VVAWNARLRRTRSEQCIHELFESSSRTHPDKRRGVYEEAQLTYAQLKCQANQLARHLRRVGVGPDARVALWPGTQLWKMVIAVLAVLKAGVLTCRSIPPIRYHGCALCSRQARRWRS